VRASAPYSPFSEALVRIGHRRWLRAEGVEKKPSRWPSVTCPVRSAASERLDWFERKIRRRSCHCSPRTRPGPNLAIDRQPELGAVMTSQSSALVRVLWTVECAGDVARAELWTHRIGWLLRVLVDDAPFRTVLTTSRALAEERAKDLYERLDRSDGPMLPVCREPLSDHPRPPRSA